MNPPLWALKEKARTHRLGGKKKRKRTRSEPLDNLSRKTEPPSGEGKRAVIGMERSYKREEGNGKVRKKESGKSRPG